MRPEIQKYATRQKWLYRAAQILAAPLQPYFMAKHGVERVTYEINKLYQQTKAKLGWPTEPKEDRPEPETDEILLPWEHPITQAVTKITTLAGVENHGVYIDSPDLPLIGGRTRYYEKSNEYPASFKIIFTGDPFPNENEPEIMMGVIGHEVAHAITPNGVKIRELSQKSSSAYMCVAMSSLAVAEAAQYLKTTDKETFLQVTEAIQITPFQLAHILQATPSYDLLAGASFIALAVGYSMHHLSRLHNHSMEYLCDLKGAELTSPKEALAGLEYFQKSKEEYAPSRLRSAWEAVLYPLADTHPNIKSRIALIKKAFNMQGDPPAPANEQKTPPPPPPPPPPSQQP